MFNRKKEASYLQKKIVDYKNFGLTSLCVAAFFYLGSVIPAIGKTLIGTYTYMGATAVFIFLAATFFLLSNKNKKILDEIDDHDSIQQ